MQGEDIKRTTAQFLVMGLLASMIGCGGIAKSISLDSMVEKPMQENPAQPQRHAGELGKSMGSHDDGHVPQKKKAKKETTISVKKRVIRKAKKKKQFIWPKNGNRSSPIDQEYKETVEHYDKEKTVAQRHEETFDRYDEEKPAKSTPEERAVGTRSLVIQGHGSLYPDSGEERTRDTYDTQEDGDKIPADQKIRSTEREGEEEFTPEDTYQLIVRDKEERVPKINRRRERELKDADQPKTVTSGVERPVTGRNYKGKAACAGAALLLMVVVIVTVSKHHAKSSRKAQFLFFGAIRNFMIRFSLSVISMIMIIIVSVLLLFYSHIKNEGEKQIKKDGAVFGRLIAEAARRKFFDKSERSTSTDIEYVVREKGLLYCMVFDGKQDTLLQLGPHIPEQYPDTEQYARNNNHLSSGAYKENERTPKIYEFSNPIQCGGQQVGLVRIGLGLSTFTYGNQIICSVVAIAVFFIAALILIGYCIVRQVLMPFHKINHDQTGITLEKNELSEREQLADRMSQFFIEQEEKIRTIKTANREFEEKSEILLYEKERIQVMLDNLKVGIVFIDATGKAVLANQEADNFLRLDRQDYLYSSWDSVLRDQNQELFHMFDEFRKKGSLFSYDFLTVESHQGDTVRVIRHDCLLLLNKEDKPLGCLWTINDITSSKHAELDRYGFVNNLASELMSALHKLQSQSELLIHEESENEENKRKILDSINVETLNLSDFINNLLNTTKSEMACSQSKQPVQMRQNEVKALRSSKSYL
ncbi:MAG: hypothetical protein ACMUIP_00960 [bacterium]